MAIGERIAARREELGLKQYQVAERIGVTKTTMSKYENNVNLPNSDILARLARTLDTSVDYLCELTDISSPYSEKWVCVDKADKPLYDNIQKLNRDNKLRLSERVNIMLEEQKDS